MSIVESPGFSVRFKEFFELSYWRITRITDRGFGNDHYKYFYTKYFQLNDDFYTGKKILDIGCGPRGSLEWANMVSERVGLDPLADRYLKMGGDKHEMTYIKSYVEKMPFVNNRFDVICSFNSLDHVSDLKKSCEEIKRVLKPGGLFLLAVDIHRMPTPTEPQRLEWSFVKDYFPDWSILDERYLKIVKRGRMYTNLRANKHLSKPQSSGVLVAKIQKL